MEAWTLLTALARETRQIRVGILVTCNGYRNPALLAKMAATVDVLTGGRLIHGIGSGWFADEYEGYGYEFPDVPTRLAQLDESLRIHKLLWTGERPSFDGRFYRLREAWCEPRPVQQPHPPILIGGGGERVLMGIAARHADIWNNLAVFQPALGAKVEALRARCKEAGREFESIEISQQCVVVIEETMDAARASLEKAKKIYGGHMGTALEEHGIWGSPEGVIERIERHVRLGCTLFPIEFFGRDTREPARLFAEKVMPAFR
jgi:alkanesulfonate monooxygenase SsuD/methylene tetrahydromethanopterin reductase-like flavin-dependent oxidoreductase (luciferase family)